ncbi:hypothetical protein THPR109532_09255 [Thalassospira profundimaris]
MLIARKPEYCTIKWRRLMKLDAAKRSGFETSQMPVITRTKPTKTFEIVLMTGLHPLMSDAVGY